MDKWRYRIQIKDLFEDETTPELVVTLCNSLVRQIKTIKEKVEKATNIESDKDLMYDELDVCQDNFEFLGKIASGEIEEKDWSNYGFVGGFEEDFNGYLEQLYDLGDERIALRNGEIEKFIWIG